MKSKQHAHANQWIYFNLYFGKTVDRMEHAIMEISALIERENVFSKWFFLRYLDDTGIHIRIRTLPASKSSRKEAEEALHTICNEVMLTLHALNPTTYNPMVTIGDASSQEALLHLSKRDVSIVPNTYEPEFEKFGGPVAIHYAESLFHVSSVLAKDILTNESMDIDSRKSIAPYLMKACFDVFKPAKENEFWRHYSRFWLGGDSPVAKDWREKFISKAEQLQNQDISIIGAEHQLHSKSQDILNSWYNALHECAQQYRSNKAQHSGSNDVLCFNFSHLMMNRLGITSMEEAYIATLLEVHFLAENRLEVVA